jgi:hypothetical protein
MTRAGVVLILLALGVAALGTLQFELVVRLSGDPTINPVGNGILMWLSWAVAGVMLVVGCALALIGRAAGRGGTP